MVTLVSPGVDVMVSDESRASSAGPGTIPLLFIATAENKTLSSSIGPETNTIAPGTTSENAGVLYLATGQRDLIQTFGDPVFYNRQGTPIPGYELNEYGLHAAYSYLGLANRAFVVRADVDLASMLPTTIEPTNESSNGRFWFDLGATKWGIFRSNGDPVTGSAWSNKLPVVVSTDANNENVVIGEVGFASNTTSVGVNGVLQINGVNVTVSNVDTINDVVNNINSANISHIKAVAIRYVGKSWVVIRNLASQSITFGGTSLVVSTLGFDTPTQILQPKFSVGAAGDYAVMPLVADNLYFEKIKPTGLYGESDPDSVAFWFLIGSDLWKAVTPTNVYGVTSSVYLTNPILSGDTLNISDGVDTVAITFSGGDVGTLNDVVSKINAQISSASLTSKFVAAIYNNQLVLVNKLGHNLVLSEPNTNSSTGITGPLKVASVKGNQLFYTPHYQVPAGSASGDCWIKVTQPNNGVNYVVKQYNRTTKIWNTLNAPFYRTDDLASAALGNVGPGVYYIRYNLYGSSANPVASHSLRRSRGVSEVAMIGNGVPGITTASLVPGDQFVITAGKTNGSQSSVVITVSGTDLEDVVTDINNSALSNVFAEVYGGYLKIGNTDKFSVSVGYYDPNTQTQVDNSNTGDPLTSFGLTDGEFVSNWDDLGYTASVSEPRSVASEGRLWYNEDLAADIMVGDGDQWFGYKNMYPNTDPNGVIIAGSAPTMQTDGTELVEHDIWLDGSDLENYPKLYRWRNAIQDWELIDNTDQTTPFGIVFQDARWNHDGSVTGSKFAADLVQSDYADPDAPDPRTFPAGTLLFNTRHSTYNVKRWYPNYFAQFVGIEESAGVQYSVGLTTFPSNTITTENKGRWVTHSGNRSDGAPYMGRKAQRRVVVKQLQAAIIGNQEVRSELAFFNLLACPGYPEVLDELITLNTDKKEIGFIVGDTPARLAPTGTAIQNWANNTKAAESTGDDGLTISNPYVGLYYPWGLGTNSDGSEIVIPPSTIALRTLGYSDSVSYPWFPPAGFTRGLVTNAASVGYIDAEGEYKTTILNQGQRDVLYLNKINPIAFIPNRGLVIYGQKTLNPIVSAMDRVNVARLINYLRFNLDILAKPFLFELNDKQVRDQVQSAFERFLGNLVSLRALYDFVVVCDESNNTPERIDRNELWVNLAVAPAKSIEFIYIPIVIANTGEDLTTFVTPSGG